MIWALIMSDWAAKPARSAARNKQNANGSQDHKPLNDPAKHRLQQPETQPPGIFILDDGVGLVAKRIEIIPSTTPQMLRISSENSAYSSYQRRIDEVHIIGRVVWFARRL